MSAPPGYTYGLAGGDNPSGIYKTGGVIPLTAQSPDPNAGGSNYNINPPTSGYNPTFGGVPGPIGLPNPFQDLSGVLPGLGGLNSGVSGALGAQLSGQLSPDTIAMLQNLSAAQGVGSGMPGSGLFRNKTARDLGLFSENLVNQGLQNYSRVIPAISGTQTVNPNLQTEIADRNAKFAAAPIPANAQSYAKSLFDQYLRAMRGPGGGTGGSYASPAGPTSTGDQALGFGFGSFGGGQAPSRNAPYSGGMPDADLYDQFLGGTPYGSADTGYMNYGDITDPYSADLSGEMSADYGGEY